MGIFIEKSGLLTTVQDYGRYGYQNSGFSVSGVMDRRSAGIANALVNNSMDEAVLEFLLMGPTIRFKTSTVISLTGADFSPKLNGQPIENYTAIQVNAEDVLELGFAKNGLWGYLAFAAKLDIPMVMGSRSTNARCNIGGFNGRKLEKEDELNFREKIKHLPNMEKRRVEPEFFGDKEKTIRVILGLQKNLFSEEGIHTFFSETYQVTEQCDRMGYRLEGPAVAHVDGGDIISDGIPLGAIQIPSHGKPIIMLVDRQTTGGYTKIGTVIGVDIPVLVQSAAGTKLHFQEISVEEAQNLYVKQMDDCDALLANLRKLSLWDRIKQLF